MIFPTVLGTVLSLFVINELHTMKKGQQKIMEKKVTAPKEKFDFYLEKLSHRRKQTMRLGSRNWWSKDKNYVVS